LKSSPTPITPEAGRGPLVHFDTALRRFVADLEETMRAGPGGVVSLRHRSVGSSAS